MFCSKCGNKVGEGSTFCSKCGSSIEQGVVNQSSQPIKKKSNKGLIIALIIVLIGFGVSLGFLIKNLVSSGSNGSSSGNLVSNSTWIASDDSEMVFKDDTLIWYEEQDEHDDNYFSGSYKFYIGKEAVEHVTTELSSFGITKSKLTSLFNRNSKYDEDNFVVIDIKYDKLIYDKEEQPFKNSHMPLYGFILNDNTYLDVANMSTGTYYKFTKK